VVVVFVGAVVVDVFLGAVVVVVVEVGAEVVEVVDVELVDVVDVVEVDARDVVGAGGVVVVALDRLPSGELVGAVFAPRERAGSDALRSMTRLNARVLVCDDASDTRGLEELSCRGAFATVALAATVSATTTATNAAANAPSFPPDTNILPARHSGGGAATGWCARRDVGSCRRVNWWMMQMH
jgi:hypothetical protein